jgi:hypothetical protein
LSLLWARERREALVLLRTQTPEFTASSKHLANRAMTQEKGELGTCGNPSYWEAEFRRIEF